MISYETLFKSLTALLNFAISIITLQSSIKNKKNSPGKEEFPQQKDTNL